MRGVTATAGGCLQVQRQKKNKNIFFFKPCKWLTWGTPCPGALGVESFNRGVSANNNIRSCRRRAKIRRAPKRGSPAAERGGSGLGWVVPHQQTSRL